MSLVCQSGVLSGRCSGSAARRWRSNRQSEGPFFFGPRVREKRVKRPSPFFVDIRKNGPHPSISVFSEFSEDRPSHMPVKSTHMAVGEIRVTRPALFVTRLWRMKRHDREHISKLAANEQQSGRPNLCHPGDLGHPLAILAIPQFSSSAEPRRATARARALTARERAAGSAARPGDAVRALACRLKFITSSPI